MPASEQVDEADSRVKKASSTAQKVKSPGVIATPINTKLLNDTEKLGLLLKNIPLDRLEQPQDVASPVAFLASSDANYVTGTTALL